MKEVYYYFTFTRTMELGAVKPQVSVSLITYNQEKYITECLDSILAQRVNFEFEIVVSDDCSGDSTPKIIGDYAKKHPHLIRVINREKNLGMVKNAIETMRECRAEYIALMEGDDFWIYDNKLQMQFDFLEKNKDCVFCYTNQLVFSEIHANPSFEKFTDANRPPQKFDLDFFLQKNIAIINNTKMFRRESLPNSFPDWFYTSYQWDWALHIMQAVNGNIAYLDHVTLAYRKNVNSATQEKNTIILMKSGLRTLRGLNSYFNYKFDHYFNNYSWHYNQLAFGYLGKKMFLHFLFYYCFFLFYSKSFNNISFKDDLWRMKQALSNTN